MPSPLSISPLAPTRTASSLHRRFLAAVAIGGAAAIALVAWGANAAVTVAADGGLTRAQGSVRIAVGVLVAALMALLVALHQFLTRRISGPAVKLAEAAEKVAAGNFAVELEHTASDDEIGRLTRAVGGMVLELRRLAGAIAGSARETTSMSHEITAGAEEMAAAAGQMAQTASELSSQATGMAETIGALAKLATTLRELSATLQEGAQEGVSRNQSLRSLANENRSGLDASSTSLGTLGEDVRASAQAVEALGDASQEIRSFVTLVRKLARQSKLLALNAAMEAARAGEHGEGFAVVASEVRRLASMSSDAAERTEQIVNGVLSGIAQSRESAGRAVATAEAVGAATSRASESFAEIEQAVVGAEEWSASVERTSAAASELIVDMTTRLDSLASGTESFAAAMEQVAASSQEQSASTEEIAGAAGALASAAERLAKIVAGLKLSNAPAVAPAAPRAHASTERAPAIVARPTLAMPVTA